MTNRILAICFFLLCSQSALAVELTVGVDAYNFDYHEQLPEPLKSTETATVFAPYATALFSTGPGGSFLKVEGEISGSVKSNYDGSTQDGIPVQDNNLQSYIRGEADYYYQISPSLFLYAGLGFRSWSRYLSGGSGYRELYNWGVMPVGVLVQFPYNSNVLIGLDASYRMMFAGQIKVIFSETVINGEDTTLSLENRPGYKLQMPIRIALSQAYAVTLAPWYEYSEIGASDFKYNSTPTSKGPLGYIQEPSSRTHQLGAEVGVTVAF